jgi:hypothetical protein
MSAESPRCLSKHGTQEMVSNVRICSVYKIGLSKKRCEAHFLEEHFLFSFKAVPDVFGWGLACGHWVSEWGQVLSTKWSTNHFSLYLTSYFVIGPFFFFLVLGLELRAYTLSQSAIPFLWRVFQANLPGLALNRDLPDLCLRVAGITGMSRWHPALLHFINLKSIDLSCLSLTLKLKFLHFISHILWVVVQFKCTWSPGDGVCLACVWQLMQPGHWCPQYIWHGSYPFSVLLIVLQVLAWTQKPSTLVILQAVTLLSSLCDLSSLSEEPV